ncbi:CARDB domain-containing protein [Fenollaria timonensis]|uniref:COG1361 S-layer family protein n=1 Tax=Fenollaria timonensis TaxID=1723384 RepID=UPI0026EEEDC7|nr:CARDB domain-containing protein [Fenollaria timonensis]
MKKIFSILLIAVMMISTLSVDIYAENPNKPSKPGQSTEPSTTPAVEEVILQSDPSLVAEQGEEKYINFSLPSGNDEITDIIASTDSPNNCYVIKTASGNGKITVKIKITNAAEQGTYKVTVKGKSGNKNVYGECNVRVNVNKRDTLGKDEEINLISRSTTELNPGEEASIYFETERPFFGLSFYGLRATSDSPNNCYITNTYGGRGDVELRVRIPQSAEAGTYKVSVAGKARIDGETVKVYGEAYVRVNGGSQNKAQLKINRVDVLPEANIVPGSYVALGYEIENISDVLAKNIDLNISLPAEAGLSVRGGTTTQKVKAIEPGKKTYVYYEMNVGKTAKFGSYEIKTSLSYESEFNKEAIKEETSAFINIGGDASQNSQLIIQDLKFPAATLGVNKTFDVSFKIRNQGQSVAKSIRASAKSDDPSGVVSRTVSDILVRDLAPGEEETVSYKFFTTKGGSTKNYPINIKIEYLDDFTDSKEPKTVEQIVGVFLNNPENIGDGKDAKKSTPKLIIDRYEFTPKLPLAGNEFEMNLSFYNTNAKKAVKNIKIDLTSQDTTDNNSNTSGSSVFTPVDSSNTFYIGRIAPNGKVEKTIKMFVVPDATAKTYTITANFEYEDDENNEYKSSENIGVPVYQESKLDIDPINYQTNAFVGDNIPITANFYNTGKVTLYNFKVTLTSDNATINNGTYYIGNFNSGGQDIYEGSIMPNEPGEIKAQLKFSYEDSTGEVKEQVEDINITVDEAPPMDPDLGPDGMPMPDGNMAVDVPWYKNPLFYIPTALVLLGAIAFVIFKKIKNKNKEKDLKIDED